jgi:hypothetical protein
MPSRRKLTMKRLANKVRTVAVLLFGFAKDVVAIVGIISSAIATVGHYAPSQTPPPAMERRVPALHSIRIETRTEVTPYDPYP